MRSVRARLVCEIGGDEDRRGAAGPASGFGEEAVDPSLTRLAPLMMWVGEVGTRVSYRYTAQNRKQNIDEGAASIA